MTWLARLPILVLTIALGGVAMLLPGFHALYTGEAHIAEVFLFDAALSLLLALFIGIAMAGRRHSEHMHRHLAGFFALFVLLPVQLALPFYQAVGNTSWLNAYVEMVSSLTTTGATMFEAPDRLKMSLHLWRATVGWLGGLFIWIGAISVLAPMSLGGFEVRGRAPRKALASLNSSQISNRADLSQRLRIHSAHLAPVYTALTALLWGALIAAGEAPAVALAHAMSVLSTSGISPVGGLSGAQAGWAGEAFIALFLVFALSRLTFAREVLQKERSQSIRDDSEIRFALALIALVAGFLFLRHFIGAFEVEGVEMSLWQGLTSLWGSVFTALSFLTTTGFVSEAWGASRAWSGLQTPGLILLGLSLVGGGVATTAGGAKLLRVYALYKHGVRELERLVHPNSVGGSGGDARRLRGRGAYMAWLFFMLMTLSVAVVMLAFGLIGLSFEHALVLTVSALTTTGPLAAVAEATPVSYAALSDSAKYILTAAMIVGRLETLAIVALFSPDLWRR